MNNKIVLITGSTDGIGKETALELAKKNAEIIIHGRSKERCENTVEEIKYKSRNNRINYFVSDFSFLSEVRNLAESIKEKYDKLDVLINNAGVYMKQKQLSKDGYEMTFAINHLSHFLLTHLILDFLIKSSARIINVSSVAHKNAKIDFENLNAENNYDAYGAYALSKLANILFTYKLADQLKREKITVNALHPGAIGTKLLHEGFSMKGKTLQQGAETPVYLASSWWVRNKTGKYFVNKKEDKSLPISYDENLQDKMWEISKKFVGLNE